MNRPSRNAGWLIALACALCMVGCDTAASGPGDKTARGKGTKAATSKTRALPKGPQRITCDKPVHDYGTVSAGSTVKHVFVVRNAGGAALTIKRASGG